MKKKSNLVIIIICVAVILLSCAFAASYLLSEGEADPGETTKAVAAENGKIEKAKKLSNAVRLVEGRDFSLSADSAEQTKQQENTLSYLSSSLFERVVVKTRAFSSGGSGLSGGEKEALVSLISELKKSKKEVFLEADLSNERLNFESLSSLEGVDGVLLSGTRSLSAKELSSAFESAKKQLGKKQIILYIPYGYKYIEKIKFREDKPELLLVALDGKTKKENKAFLEKFRSLCEGNNLSLCVGVRLLSSESGANAASALENVVLAEEFSFVTSRLFLDLGNAVSDEQGCFSAVSGYLSEGLDLSLALASLSIDGYSKGDTVQTGKYKISLVLRGSNLFPFFLDGEEIAPASDGTAEVDLSLKNGENKFVFSQCGKKLTYLVNVNFEDEVIREIKPASALYAMAGKELTLTVLAAAGAEITVRAGAARYTAKQSSQEKDGYCTYTATFTAPNTKLEIDSIGKLNVTAVYEGETYTEEGPAVIYAGGISGEEATPVVSPSKKKEEKPTVANNVGTEPNAASQTTQAATTAQPYTGNQMCVVTSDYADTWAPETNDDSFVPYYTPLVKGTIDYVIGQSQLYDSEEGVTRDFYSLSSGRRVLTKDVRLVPYSNQGDNRITTASSAVKNGDLEIRLSMDWEVPYSFSFGPQVYYSANSKKYNVSDFTARFIQFTFYYTSSAGGSIDASQSNVVSYASWSADHAQNTVSLTFELKQQGDYYGYSITRDSNGQLVITIKGKPNSLSGTLVVLDPGHGGTDVGALGLDKTAYESRINLALAAETKAALEKRGATVLLTRTDDTDVTLEERKAYARNNGADLFVSIHCNGSVNASKLGTSVYYYRPFSQPLASAVYEKMLALFQNDFYASDAAKRSACAVGTLYNPFSVTRLEECPSILVETAFVTNDNECRLLLDGANREKIAEAIASGIESYLNG